MSGSDTTEELLEGTSIRYLVIHLGIPAMFGQFFNILYNIVDRIFIGRIPETGGIALASIGVCAPALTALSAFAFMVGIGGASYMSISLGQKNRHRAQEVIGNAFLMLLIIIFLNASLRKYGGDTQGDLLLTCAAVVQSFIICLGVLPLFLDIRYIFCAGAISDAVGASFSLLLFFSVINPRIRCELSPVE